MPDPCLYSDKINETHKILTGNGNPENGMCRQVALINERQQGVLKTLGYIDDKLKEVNANHNVLLGEITIVGKNLATLDGKITGKETTIKSVVKNGLIIFGFFVTIGIALWTRSSSQTNSVKLDKVNINQDSIKNEIKKSTMRGVFVIPVEKPFDIKKHEAFADSIIKAFKK